MPTEYASICAPEPAEPIHLEGNGGGNPQDGLAPARRATASGYVWEGHEHLGTLTEGGIYRDTTYSAETGCATAYYTLQLTKNYPTTSDTTAVECTSFTWHGTE